MLETNLCERIIYNGLDTSLSLHYREVTISRAEYEIWMRLLGSTLPNIHLCNVISIQSAVNTCVSSFRSIIGSLTSIRSSDSCLHVVLFLLVLWAARLDRLTIHHWHSARKFTNINTYYVASESNKTNWIQWCSGILQNRHVAAYNRNINIKIKSQSNNYIACNFSFISDDPSRQLVVASKINSALSFHSILFTIFRFRWLLSVVGTGICDVLIKNDTSFSDQLYFSVVTNVFPQCVYEL